MPIYEYRCLDCRKKSTFVTLSVNAVLELRCQHCAGPRLQKLVSRVAIFRSEGSRQESLDDAAALSNLDENDPKSMARWMKKMGRETGEDAGEDFDREVDEAVEEAGREKEEGGGPDKEGGEESGGGDDDSF